MVCNVILQLLQDTGFSIVSRALPYQYSLNANKGSLDSEKLVESGIHEIPLRTSPPDLIACPYVDALRDRGRSIPLANQPLQPISDLASHPREHFLVPHHQFVEFDIGDQPLLLSM